MSIQGYALLSARNPPEPASVVGRDASAGVVFALLGSMCPTQAVIRSCAFVLHVRDLGTEKSSPRLPLSCPHTSTGVTSSIVS